LILVHVQRIGTDNYTVKYEHHAGWVFEDCEELEWTASAGDENEGEWDIEGDESDEETGGEIEDERLGGKNKKMSSVEFLAQGGA
jgi:hypothetical protein